MNADASRSRQEQEAIAGPRAPRSGDLELRVVTSEDELDALAPAWTALHLATGATVFQSWEWQRSWWKHVGRRSGEEALHVVVLAAGGEVVCIAPLHVQLVRVFRVVKLRRLAFVGRRKRMAGQTANGPGRKK